MKITTTRFSDPGADGRDWPEQWPQIEKGLRKHIKKWPGQHSLEFGLRDISYPLGADLPAVAILILKFGGLLISIPAAHKLIRESVSEWRKIWSNISKFFAWIEQKEEILSYSQEVAFYKALVDLEDRTDVDALELVEATEIPGATDSPDPGFETAMLLYYLFTFRGSGRLFIVVYDSKLNLVSEASLPLHPATHCEEIEQSERRA